MYIYRFFISIIYDTITLLFCFYKTKPLKFRTWILTLNCWGRGGEINLTPCLPFWFFQKSIFWREGQILIFVTFNIIISHIFPENFIKIPQVVQKIWRFLLEIWRGSQIYLPSPPVPTRKNSSQKVTGAGNFFFEAFPNCLRMEVLLRKQYGKWLLLKIEANICRVVNGWNKKLLGFLLPVKQPFVNYF